MSEVETPAEPAKAESSDAGQNKTTTWIVILASLACIIFCIFYIKARLSEPRDESGMTWDDRSARDRNKAGSEADKIEDAIELISVRDPMLVAGLSNPPFIAADQAKVKDSERVIGIHKDGKSRAYLLGAMSFKDTHIVHDELAGMPLTISYCDVSDHVRIFHRDFEPRFFRLAGFRRKDGHMILMINGRRYPQDSEKTGLKDFKDFEVATWGEWKKKHPQTEIFTSRRRK